MSLNVTIKEDNVKLVDFIPDPGNMMRLVGIGIRSTILRRVDNGQEIEGGSFKPYDRKYETWKRANQKKNLGEAGRKGMKRGWWLVLGGSMLRSFDLVEVSAEMVTLGFSGTHTEMPRTRKRKPSKSKSSKTKSKRSVKRTGGGSEGKGRQGGISIGKPPQNWELAFLNNLTRPFIGFTQQELDIVFDEVMAELIKRD